MYKGLIDNMAFAYSYICKARRKIGPEALRAIANGQHVMVENAQTVLGGEEETKEDHADFLEVVKIDEHIEEMTVFLTSLEIA